MKNAFVILGTLVLLTACSSAPAAAPIPELIRLPLPESLPEWATKGGIYEIFIRNFTPEGTFKAAEAQLPRVKALGVKTLWLMPFHPIGEKNRKGTLGSPYSIRDFYAVDPAHGTLEDFRSFVKAAHDLDLKVIMDLVASHSAWDNRWVTEYPEYYLKDSLGNIRAPGPDWTDVAGFDYKVPELRKAMTEVMKFWVKEMNIDGWRCDVAYRMPDDFWKEAIAEVQKIKPVLMLAEGTEPRLVSAGFQMIYGSVAYQNLKGVFEEGVANDFVRTAFDEWTAVGGAPLLRFITNHDETSWSETPPVLFHSQRGAQAAAVATFLLPGIPLVYNGQELGSELKANLFEKNSYDWGSAPEIQTFYRKLLTLWAAEPAFHQGSMDVQDLEGAEGVASYARDDGKTRIIILANFRNQEQEISLPAWWKEKTYTDLWSGEVWKGGVLGPQDWKILKTEL